MLEAEYPQNTEKSQYVKIENQPFPVIADRDSPWTETEELLLLEGLEMYDDDWNKISDWVGSRTREECVLKFLQLEIEDKYVEPEPGMDAAATGAGVLSYLGQGRVPFSQADNPVLSTMSYLVGLADPSVTAAAAGKSVEEVRRVMRARLEKNSNDKGKEREGDSAAPASSEVKAEDSMDVDATTSPQPSDANAVATRSAGDKDSANPMVTVPFALSAARAAALASHEERSLTRLIHTATNLQMEKLELKHKQFSELENLLSAERRDLERRRQALFLDRLAFQKKCRSVMEAFERAAQVPPQEGMRIVQEAVRAAGPGEGVRVAKGGAGAMEGGEVGPVEGGKSYEI
jgi:SWI/SNF related-matrix-associated actin-dependent regulator of chromatin subfamily C